MVNANLYETSNFDNITNEVPPQDSNDTNKTKEFKNVCPISSITKEKNASIETNYNEWFGLRTYTRVIHGEIYSVETLHL